MVKCPKCNNSIQPNDVSLKNLKGYCGKCDHLFSISLGTTNPSALPAHTPETHNKWEIPRQEPLDPIQKSDTQTIFLRKPVPPPPLPRDLSMKFSGDMLHFSYSWFSPMNLILSAIGFVFVATIAGMCLKAYLDTKDIYWLLITFCFVSIPGYIALALSFNSTRIKVSREMITVTMGPIPWWRGSPSYELSEILHFIHQESEPTEIFKYLHHSTFGRLIMETGIVDQSSIERYHALFARLKEGDIVFLTENSWGGEKIDFIIWAIENFQNSQPDPGNSEF
ncbi:MAG: hypothetical protein HQM10_16350 [Candidatus Riflebacteria bacterium]|nr:hypothetical protein [Candidatus Riflebacteria bacterium]